MGLEVDYYNHLIKVTSPTTAVSGQTLHNFIEDAMSTPEGSLYGDIIKPEGKVEDPSNPGTYSQIIIILNSPWQIQFWSASGYTRIYGAKIVGGLSNQPFKATGTAGDITVLESPVDGVTTVVTTGSGVTEQDKDDIRDKVWNALLTGNTYNIPTSAGRRVRSIASNVITEGKAVSSTANTIVLNSDASSVDGAYDPAMISIVEGTGLGQTRGIFQYAGATKTAVIDRDWKIQPDTTSGYVIVSWAGREHVNEGLARGGTANTITLNALASSLNGNYKRQGVFVRSGLGQDQVRMVIAYDGATKIATVDEAWGIIPDITSGYIIVPIRGDTIEDMYAGKLFLDLSATTTGSVYPFGTKKYPANNLADILLLSTLYGPSTIHIIGNLSITGGEDISGFTFTSDRSIGNSVSVTSAITNDTYFDNLTVSGTMNGVVRYTFCVLGNIIDFSGGAKESLLVGDLTLTGTGNNYLTNVDTYISDATSYRKIVVGNSKLNMIRCEGNYEIDGKTGTDYTRLNIIGGHIKVNSNCVAGIIHLEGIGICIDNSGSGCDVQPDHFLSPDEVASSVWDHSEANAVQLQIDDIQTSVAFIRDIEGGRWRIVGNQMIFYKDDNVTEVTRFNLTYDANQNPIERVKV